MNGRDAAARIPVTVLTGFLGSGKTTLLNRMLRAPVLSRTLVLINEFGAVGLDHLFVGTGQERLVLLDNGCVCCTIRGDLAETLREIEGQTPNFDRVVVETTGIADPIPILHTVMADPVLAAKYRVEGVLTTIDAVNGVNTLAIYPEAVRQVAAADRVLVTKSDIASPAAVAEIEARVNALNPMATILIADHGAVDLDAVLSVDPTASTDRHMALAKWLAKAAALETGCGHANCDGHHHHHAHDAYQTLAFTIDTPIDQAAFAQWLDYLTALQGDKLLRFKGILCTARDPARPVVVHGVQHILHPAVELDAWPSDDHRTRLVFIAKDLPRALIERTLAKFGAIRVNAAAQAA